MSDWESAPKPSSGKWESAPAPKTSEWETASPKEGEHKQGIFETFGTHALASVPSSATAVMGAEAGAALGTMAMPGFGTVAGGILGAAAGGFAGSAAMRELLPDSINKYLDEGAKQNPVPAFTGDIASFGSVAKMGVPATKTAAATLMAAGAAMEGGREAVSQEKMDPTKIAISALTTPIFGGDKTKFGELVTGDKKLDVSKLEFKNKETTEDLTKEVTKRTEWEPPKEIGGVKVKVGPTGREKDDLTPVMAHFDHAKNEIVLDKEAITKSFEEKPWIKFGRPENTFRTPEEYMQFVLAHEQEHTLQSFDEYKQVKENNLPPKETDIHLTDKELYDEYHKQINARAWERLQSTGFQEGRVDLDVPKDWSTPDQYRDNLGLLNNLKTSDKITLNALVEKGKEEGITEEMNIKFRKLASGQNINLSQKEQKLYDTYYKPFQEADRDLLKQLMEDKVIPKEDLEELTAHRQLQPLTEEQLSQLKGVEDQSTWDKVKSAIDEMTTSQGGFDANMNKVRSSGKLRSLYALEGSNGTRRIVQFTKKGDLIEWDKGKARGLGPVPFEEEYKSGDKIAGGTLRHATEEEIETHSPYRYVKDYQAVLYGKYAETREMARNYQAIEALKESPDFGKIAHKISSGKEMPEGFARPKFLDRLPNLEGYAFETRTAQIIEDFARVRTPNMLNRISGLLIQNMMLNPLPHMFNEAMHLYNARGLTGWVTPAGIGRFFKHTTSAVRSVITQDESYRDIIKSGGHMLAPGTRFNAIEDSLYKKGVDEFAKTPEFKDLAKSLGKSTKDLYLGLSKASSKAMWVTRDIMYMQYVNELKATKGLSTADAVKEAERHMPNYQLPERVGNKVLGAKLSRGLSEFLNNPNVSVFSRYHYGMVKSMIETAKDVGAIRKGKEGLQEFKEGMDTVAAIAVALSVLYPLMDMAAQELTGNKNAKQRRAGPYHVINAVTEVAEGTKEPQAVLASVFTFNPALLGLAQLGVDRQLYNGQPIYHPTDSAEVIAKDVGTYLAKQVPSVSTSLRVSDESGGGAGQLIAQQIDIQSPSQKQVDRIEKIRHRDIRASEIREQKRRLREYFNN